jgi:hypothetical protein
MIGNGWTSAGGALMIEVWGREREEGLTSGGLVAAMDVDLW